MREINWLLETAYQHNTGAVTDHVQIDHLLRGIDRLLLDGKSSDVDILLKIADVDLLSGDTHYVDEECRSCKARREKPWRDEIKRREKERDEALARVAELEAEKNDRIVALISTLQKVALEPKTASG